MTTLPVRIGAVGIGVALSLPIALVNPTATQAKNVREYWQITLQMPPQLWDDGAGLPMMMGNTPDVFRVGRTKYTIIWTNASVRQMPKYMLRQQGAPYGATTAGLYDKRLTKKQLRKFRLKQRVLWMDADVLVAGKGSPLCDRGLTTKQLNGVLDGSITNWRQVFPQWPQGAASTVTLKVPLDYTGEPRWTFGRGTYRPGAQRTTDSGTLSVSGGSVAVQKLSLVARYLAGPSICAVPIDGVAPSEQTTRHRSYPHAYTVYYVSRKKPTKGVGAKPRQLIKRWESFLFGPLGDEYLRTSLGRTRYLP